MDYTEEQKSEIEALESIYYGDLKLISTEPCYKFTIPVKSEQYEPDTENGVACNLIFAFTSKYPEEPPLIEIEDSENFKDKQDDELLTYLQLEAKENVGMVMIFTLVSAAQEWLNLRWEELKTEYDERRIRKLQEDEEIERKRFDGTKVTVESFLKWKMMFDDEMGITKKKEIIEKEGRKLTGRELFMTDKTLNESDLKFLDDGETVKVDESLFQDLEDLDLDGTDDPDFDPDNYNSDSS